MSDPPEVGSLWRHYKGGLYRVVGRCRIEETLADAVLYVAADALPGATPWCRPLRGWQMLVPLPGRRHVPRFEEVVG